MSITQISIFLENKVGQLAQVCKVLADNDVSLVTLSLAETADFGIARLVVDDTAKAEDVLRRNKYIVKATPVVAVAVPDRPGGMAEVVSTLSAKGCDIEYSYAFALRHGEKAVLVFRFKNNEQATAVIAEAGFATLTENQIQDAAK
ncbi:MAG: ACT domain-containing protein [Kiritimatiellae bacterium]|nr:ACT domain-containing protein [Kiritimatiellia bacterium]